MNDLRERTKYLPTMEPIGFCEDTVLSLAERTFSTEVDEQLAEDVIQYARRLHTLYTAPQPSPDVSGLADLEILLHSGLYEAVQESYKGWSCEISTHNCGDCVNVHLMLKSGKVIASVGKYRAGMDEENFYKQIIGELR